MTTDRAEPLGTLKATLDSEHLHDNSRDVAYYHRSPFPAQGTHCGKMDGAAIVSVLVCKLKNLATDMQYGTILPCRYR